MHQKSGVRYIHRLQKHIHIYILYGGTKREVDTLTHDMQHKLRLL